MQQQDQTKQFFDGYSKEWKSSALKKDGVIQQRNNFSLRLARDIFGGDLDTYMDAGCGTGDLVQQMSPMCKKAVGIDFAESMILECINLKEENSLTNCSFFVADSLSYGESESFDMISANGFIEYISLNQLNDFLRHMHSVLKPGGIIALGSRNRLFNLVTLNDFTLDEYSEERSVRALVAEACELASASSDFDLGSFCKKESSVNFQEENYTHPVTGIKVSQRFQYTPLQLSNLLKEHGFITKRISGCNYHSFPLVDNSRDIVPPENSLNHIPYCSTFMIAGSKL